MAEKDDPTGLLEALPDAVLVVEGETVAWVNRAAAAMLRAAPEAIAGRALSDWLVPGEAKRLSDHEAQRAQGWTVPDSLRLRFAAADGAEVPAEVRPARTGSGCLLLSARDATEARAAEQLMARLADLSAHAEAMLDVDTLLDAASPVFAALGWMAAFTEVHGDQARVRRVVGAAAGNAVADYALSLVGKDSPLERYPVVREVMRTRAPVILDNLPALLPQDAPARAAEALSESMRQARGKTRSVWLPVPDEGGDHVLTVAGDNLTGHDHVAIQLFGAQVAAALRLSRLRAELVRRERLAAVGEMSAVMAHEVRNPLGVIFNALEGLGPNAGRPEAAQLLAVLREEAERLRRLVGDLLDFARPPTHEPRMVVLSGLIRDAVEAARKDPGCHGLRYRVKTAVPEDLPRAWADPLALRRALVNLIVNAMQNVPAGGEIRVAAEAAPAGAELRIRVANDGAPIPPELAVRMFEPFFTTRATGTGLGLAVVKQMVERNAGRVELESLPTGVSFLVTVPAAPPR